MSQCCSHHKSILSPCTNFKIYLVLSSLLNVVTFQLQINICFVVHCLNCLLACLVLKLCLFAWECSELCLLVIQIHPQSLLVTLECHLHYSFLFVIINLTSDILFQFSNFITVFVSTLHEFHFLSIDRTACKLSLPFHFSSYRNLRISVGSFINNDMPIWFVEMQLLFSFLYCHDMCGTK